MEAKKEKDRMKENFEHQRQNAHVHTSSINWDKSWTKEIITGEGGRRAVVWKFIHNHFSHSLELHHMGSYGAIQIFADQLVVPGELFPNQTIWQQTVTLPEHTSNGQKNYLKCQVELRRNGDRYMYELYISKLPFDKAKNMIRKNPGMLLYSKTQRLQRSRKTGKNHKPQKSRRSQNHHQQQHSGPTPPSPPSPSLLPQRKSKQLLTRSHSAKKKTLFRFRHENEKSNYRLCQIGLEETRRVRYS